MGSGIEAFIKAIIVSGSQPLKLTTLGSGIILSIFFPPLTLAWLGLAGITTSVLIAIDLSDDSFLKKALTPPQQQYRFQDMQKELRVQLRSSHFSHVQEDVQDVSRILHDVEEAIKQLPGDAIQSKLIIENIAPTVRTFIGLSKQEHVIRNYLKDRNNEVLTKEIEDLTHFQSHTTDEIAKQTYQKALNVRSDQKNLVQSMTDQLDQIESKISQIKAILEQAHAYVIKSSIEPNTQTTLTEGEILIETLKHLS